MSRRNVFAVARSIWDDADFAPEPFSEREAWMWLVSAAAWKDIRARGNSGPVNLKRGEFSFSVRFLAEKFQWTKDKTHRFVKRLEKRDMIRDSSRDSSQIYSIKNYNSFQVVGVPRRDSDSDTSRDTTATAARQQRDKEETGETGKQDNKEVSLAPDGADSLPVTPPAAPPSKPSKAEKPEPDGFSEFYDAYPLRKARPAAAKAYAAALTRAPPDTLLAGARRYADTRRGEDPKFTKHPATWLNQDCWLDEEAPRGITSTRAFRQPSLQSFAAHVSRAVDARSGAGLFGESSPGDGGEADTGDQGGTVIEGHFARLSHNAG